MHSSRQIRTPQRPRYAADPDELIRLRQDRLVAIGRSFHRATGWILVSAAFGVTDERLTRTSLRPIADTANSPWLWACWPLLVGMGIGGSLTGAITGAIGTVVALLGFFVVHGTSLSNAWNAETALVPVGLLVGFVAGGLGGRLRRRT